MRTIQIPDNMLDAVETAFRQEQSARASQRIQNLHRVDMRIYRYLLDTERGFEALLSQLFPEDSGDE